MDLENDGMSSLGDGEETLEYAVTANEYVCLMHYVATCFLDIIIRSAVLTAG